MDKEKFVPFGGDGAQVNDINHSRVVVLPLCYENAPSYGAGSGQGPFHILDASLHIEHLDEEAMIDWSTHKIHTLQPIFPSDDPQEAVAEMEKALKDTLTRAQRWGAVMLIDEADVYIKRRDDNIAANAVVGVFLRVLEYFNGLLFLTTNRVDDIDEAIVSRCIAMIKYHTPHAQDRRKIWQVMTKQFALDLDEQLIEELVRVFPEATGRDIKGLTKLVAKFCQHKNMAPALDVFKRCCIFRGMEFAHSE